MTNITQFALAPLRKPTAPPWDQPRALRVHPAKNFAAAPLRLSPRRPTPCPTTSNAASSPPHHPTQPGELRGTTSQFEGETREFAGRTKEFEGVPGESEVSSMVSKDFGGNRVPSSAACGFANPLPSPAQQSARTCPNPPDIFKTPSTPRHKSRSARHRLAVRSANPNEANTNLSKPPPQPRQRGSTPSPAKTKSTDQTHRALRANPLPSIFYPLPSARPPAPCPP
jgi:hypothetical protein